MLGQDAVGHPHAAPGPHTKRRSAGQHHSFHRPNPCEASCHRVPAQLPSQISVLDCSKISPTVSLLPAPCSLPYAAKTVT